MIKIFMNGCSGRMGHVIAQMCNESDEFEMVAGGDIFVADDITFPVFTNLDECNVDFDAIIDFSNAKAVPAIVDFAVKNNKPLVLCTTGIDDETLKLVDEAAKVIPVFKSANMSYGMNVVFELVKQATKALYPACDIEIVEAHHNRKLDAPSGTAMTIAEVINEQTGNELEYVYDRHAERKARDKKELGMSAIRGGNIVGEHDVYFICDEEIVKISHSAQTRNVFARGSLTAAKFMLDKAPGYYSMSDIVSKVLGI